MRALSIIALLAALVLPSGHALASPPIDISAADLQALQTQAAQGFAPAQNNLGLLYDNGRGVPMDYTKAREWFEKAAAQGDAGAQYNLGGLYDYGKGVPQEYADAQVNLGIGRFHKAMLIECYRVVFLKKIYRTMEELQTDLDAWMEEYNH